MKTLKIVAVVLGGFLINQHPEITRPLEVHCHSDISGFYYTGTLHITRKDHMIFTKAFGSAVPLNASSQELINTRLSIGSPDTPYQASVVLQIGILKQESTTRFPNENNTICLSVRAPRIAA